jgi:2,6-dihydroxypyridine 3-monooxygenase
VEALFDAAAAALPASLAEIVIQSREPFVQVVVDVEVTRMVFGRICLIGDAAFAIRPHAAAGTAKAAEDAWRLSAAVERARGDVTEALARLEPAQLALGRQVLERARDIGNRSQFLGPTNRAIPTSPSGSTSRGDSSLAP